jgi:ribose transport system ATP-binding protein
MDTDRVRSGRSPGVEIRGLRKSFGSRLVLNDINIDFPAGQLVGLMGPNGAGKSTLIKILAGVYTADAGEFFLGKKKVRSLSSQDEVGFIHQDLGLIDDLPIVDNLRLGGRPLRRFGPILDLARERAVAVRALERVGLDRRVDTFVGELSPGEKTLVALARVLDRGVTTVFVDEATSTLPEPDANRVIDSLKASANAGATIVMVTHKLTEIVGIADRVVILIDGRVAADKSNKFVDRNALAMMLVDSEIDDSDAERSGRTPGDPVLEMRDAKSRTAGPVNLELRRGEIVGLTGRPGSGLHDVAMLASGHIAPLSGEVSLVQGASRALVPPNRETEGGFNDLDVRENMTLSRLGNWRTPWRSLRLRDERKAADEMISRLGIQPPQSDAIFGTLSGGNKQKAIFGRVLFREPDVYVLCEPTRGVDVQTRAELYRIILSLTADAAVLIVTSDAEDLFAVCDRVGIVDEGVVKRLQSFDGISQSDIELLV